MVLFHLYLSHRELAMTLYRESVERTERNSLFLFAFFALKIVDKRFYFVYTMFAEFQQG